MTLVCATVEDFIINTHEIYQTPWWSSIKVINLINLAKKSSQYAENSIFHMIDIFLCPEQEPYYSAQEQKMTSVHPENIRICESLLRELSSRGSWHRYVVMEALVLMCSGKSNINLEDQAKKLVDVLVVVILKLFLESWISPCHVSHSNYQIPSEERCGRKQFPQALRQTSLPAWIWRGAREGLASSCWYLYSDKKVR